MAYKVFPSDLMHVINDYLCSKPKHKKLILYDLKYYRICSYCKKIIHTNCTEILRWQERVYIKFGVYISGKTCYHCFHDAKSGF